MVTEVHQLPLPVALRDEATLDNFWFAPALAPLRGFLQQRADTAETVAFIAGPIGSGRTHLLQAACQGWPPGEALYLPLADLQAMDPTEVLAGVEQLRHVSLDDLQVVAGDAAWEEALFHCYNRALASGCRLLFSADQAPLALPLGLADLASRLSAALVFQLPAPGDAEKAEILRLRAHRRGLQLSAEVADYILHRAPRSLDALLGLLDQLDAESLAHQRALTIPFVRASLGW